MTECSREIAVTNTLSDPLVLYKIEIGAKAQNYFSFSNIDQPIFIQPLQKSKLFELSFTKCSFSTAPDTGIDCPEDINIESTITLHTNASTFVYPLLYYSGMIKYDVVWLDKEFEASKDVLDFGLTSVDEQKCVLLALHNHNNRVVKVNSYSIDIPNGKFDLWPLSSLHIKRENGGMIEEDGEEYRSVSHKRRGESGFPLVLDRNSTTFLEACCHVAATVAELSSILELQAEFQTVRIPVEGRFSDGRIKVIDPPLILPPSFPGKKVFAELTVYSTFKETFEISHVVSESPDNLKWQKYKSKEIRPMTRTKVGKIEFDAGAKCNDCKCIGSLAKSTECGRPWHERLEKPHTAAKIDGELYKHFREQFRKPIKTSMVLYTKLMTAYDFEVKTDVQWPRLAKQNAGGNFISEPIQFPPTVVSAKVTGQRTLVIENPTDYPIIVQPILLGDMEQKHKIEAALKDDYPFLDLPKNAPKYSDDFGIGMNRGGDRNLKKGDVAHARPRWLLPPGARENLHLGFLPKEAGDHEAVLLLRNNLTVLEPIRLVGRGIRENLTLFNGNDIFIMSMRDEDLKECYDSRPSDMPFRKGSTTKIKIQNYSSIGSKIRSIKINNETCSGSGWEVIECKNGQLPSNFVIPSPSNGNSGVKEIKLKYRPDFSMLETNCKMTIETEYGAKFTFSLTAKIPEKHIEACRAAIPRPPWEPACRRIILIMMVVLLVGILLMGFIEASYIVEPWLMEVKSRPVQIANITALTKLYPEYSRRPKLIPSPCSMGPAILKTTNQSTTSNTDPVRIRSDSIRLSRSSITQSTDCVAVKPHNESASRLSKSTESIKIPKKEEEVPAWVDEPVATADHDFARFQMPIDHFGGKAMSTESNGVVKPSTGRMSPSGSLSSIQSSLYPTSDTSDMNKNGEQSNSSLSSKGQDSDENASDHDLLNERSRNDQILRALYPIPDGVFDRNNTTPPSHHPETPNSSSSGVAEIVGKDPLGLDGLRTFEPFDRAPGPRRHFPPGYPPGGQYSRVEPGYPYYDNYSELRKRHGFEPTYIHDAYGRHQQPYRKWPKSDPVYDPVTRAQNYITPAQQSAAYHPPPGFEHTAGDRHSVHWPSNDQQFFQFMPEDQRRKLREDVEKEGDRFDFKNIWKN